MARTLSRLIVRVDEMSRGELFTSQSLYDSLTGSSKELESFVRELRENPGKFLRVNLNLF
jgi:hypothetical protein